MGYACGDCYAKHQIQKVITGDSILKRELPGRDVKMIFKSEELEKKIDSITGQCAICYDYYVEGFLNYKKDQEFSLLEAENCEVKLKDPDCCGK